MQVSNTVPGSGARAVGLGCLHGASPDVTGPEQLLPFCFADGWLRNTKSKGWSADPVVSEGEAAGAPSGPTGIGSADGEKNLKATGVTVRSAKPKGFSNSSGGGS